MNIENNGEMNQPETNESSKEKQINLKPYLSIAIMVIIVFFVCLAGFFFIYRFDGVSNGISQSLRSVRGIVIGLVLAYLLSPILNFFEKKLKKLYKKEMTLRQKRFVRGISVTITMIVFLAAVTLLLVAIVPSVVKSVEELVRTMGDKLNAMYEWIDGYTKNDNGEIAIKIQGWINAGSDKLVEWMETNILGNSGDILASVTKGVYSALRTLFSIIVGLIISVYVMMRKEVFVAQAKKIIYAVFRPRYGNYVMEVIHKADEVFGGFFIGKIIDSIIIGFICFGCMYLMKMPYIVLISVIIGITNIIPFFGPYVGAIPCVILVFLVNPLQSLYFIIFILVLQQFDGNILGPRILSNTTGLSPFWVIFSVLAFGGAWGVVGMIVGVPVFAVIYYVVKRIAEHLLKKRKLPEETMKYADVGSVNLETNELLERPEKVRILQHPKNKKCRNKKEDE